jgi:hypothetical protein
MEAVCADGESYQITLYNNQENHNFDVFVGLWLRSQGMM